MAIFPIMFLIPLILYSTTWVAECVYTKPEDIPLPTPNPPTNTTMLMRSLFHSGIEKVNLSVPEEGVRMGAFALTLFSLVSLLYTCILPPLLTAFGIKPVYMLSQALFAFCMLATNLISSGIATFPRTSSPHRTTSTATPTTPAEILAILFISTCGISWATSMVVPFSLIGNYVNQGEDGGLILGIHNIFIVLPQIVTTLFSSLVFMVTSGTRGLQFIFTCGGLSAIVSAIWIYALKES
jgi:MFS family permease